MKVLVIALVSIMSVPTFARDLDKVDFILINGQTNRATGESYKVAKVEIGVPPKKWTLRLGGLVNS